MFYRLFWNWLFKRNIWINLEPYYYPISNLYQPNSTQQRDLTYSLTEFKAALQLLNLEILEYKIRIHALEMEVSSSD